MADASEPRMPDAQEMEQRARERAQKLAGTIEVFKRYDWGDDLLVIDPDDLLVDRPENPARDDQPAHPVLIRTDFERFVDEDYVGRVLARGEALLEEEMALDLRDELRETLDILEDLTIPPHYVGFHVGVLAGASPPRPGRARAPRRGAGGGDPGGRRPRRAGEARRRRRERGGPGRRGRAADRARRGGGPGR
jgi:hypothetical protein